MICRTALPGQARMAGRYRATQAGTVPFPGAGAKATGFLPVGPPARQDRACPRMT